MAVKKLFRISLGVLLFFLIGLLYIFFDSYYFNSLKIVSNANDPRWRVFDFNSRQATEEDIYNVKEVPVISDVKLVANRKLRFYFQPPIETDSWKVINVNTGRIINESDKPEIQFPDTSINFEVQFIPKGVKLFKDFKIYFSYFPKVGYEKSNLSWGDNFYTPFSNIPFSFDNPYSIDDWVGFSEDDPELIEAKKILGNSIDTMLTVLEQSQQIYCFVMNKLIGSNGIPSDEVQSASPLETYKLLSSGKGKGFCENKALVYYLFANAAGIKTRLVDQAGKFGPLKITGHYYCESWIPEYAKWVYVDPQMKIANIKNSHGIPLHTVEFKKLIDLDALKGTIALMFDEQEGTLFEVSGDSAYNKIDMGMGDEIVLAYKFGYGNNKSFNKVSNFLKYTTLLYAPFSLPALYIYKYIFMYGFIISLIVTLILWVISYKIKNKKEIVKV